MKTAMIFAAGLGTRLRPLTDKMPKALVPYGEKPMLELLIDKLKAAGYDDFVINLHHFADMIETFIKEKNNFNTSVRFSSERDLLRDTGGGIKYAEHLLETYCPVLVHNVDIVTDLDYEKVLSWHQDDAVATLIVSQRKTSRYLLFDNYDRLVGWTNIDTGEVKTPYSKLDLTKCRKYAFSGVQIISSKIFSEMKDFPDVFSIIDFYLSVCDKCIIRAKCIDGLIVKDLGKIQDLIP